MENPVTFRKALEFDINISAHSPQDMREMFAQIIFDVYRKWDSSEETVNIASSSGYVLKGTIDKNWSEELYTEELMAWAERNRKVAQNGQ